MKTFATRRASGHAAVPSTTEPRRRLPVAMAAAGLGLLLSACGGGGGGGVGAGDPQQPAVVPPVVVPLAVVVSGVVATGAPMAAASVKVSDRLGAEVCSTNTDNAGAYSCTLAAGVQGPLAVVARLDETVLVSTTPSALTGTVNVTPLTTLIAARLTPGGNPTALGEAIRLDPAVASAVNVQARVDEVKAWLAPLLAATGDTLNPISGQFTADGTGHDKVLDMLQVSIRPEINASNIEITVKARPASDSAAPLSLSFKSSDLAPAALTGEIRAADLPDSLPGQLNGLMGRMTACYAEPLPQRIQGAETGAAVAVGTAADVKAPPCKGLFVDDDPTAYKDNGARVGSSGAFPGMFTDAATGAKFDRANFEYQWANGDYHITFRSITRSGVLANSAITVRRQGGQLKAVGNQYQYEANVRPTAVHREFPAQPQFSWLASGYSANIRNSVDPVTQVQLFREAKLTAPDGRQTLFRPLPGTTNLGIVSTAGRQTTNSGMQLAAVFVDPTTPGHPAQKDGNGGATFVEPQLDDDALRALPDQGVWTIEWVHADSEKPNVVQTYRTLSRAPTRGEVRQRKWVDLTPEFKAELMARSDVTMQYRVVFGVPSVEQPSLPTFATAAGGDGWRVPEGALAPRSLSVFGQAANGGAYSNNVALQESDRKAVVPCRTQSSIDLHCDNSLGVLQFAAGSRFNYFDLSVTTARQINVNKQFGLYRLAD